jgi:cell wall-active antibiotic response 4TMS protein YvqF
VSVRPGTIGLVLALLPAAAEAQTMRPFTTFRQVHGETRLDAKLEYGAGSLRISPGQGNELYRMNLSYDENRFIPLSDFDVARGSVLLGLRAAGEGGVRVVSRNQLQQVAMVGFSPRVDLALDLALGAVDAEVELGGLRISSLALKTGASQAVVRFSKPNLTRCRRADFSAGAAQLALLGLGNSRCDDIGFEGGMGKVTLDFGGAWTSSARVQVRMAVGELTLRLPRRIGVRITMDKFLSRFQGAAGLERRGEAFQSRNYDTSQRHLDLDLTTAVGGVNVEWVE